jgi:hypothetical protein
MRNAVNAIFTATGRRAPSMKEWAGRSAPVAKSLSISVPFVVYFVSPALKVPVRVGMGGVQLDSDSFLTLGTSSLLKIRFRGL